MGASLEGGSRGTHDAYGFQGLRNMQKDIQLDNNPDTQAVLWDIQHPNPKP